MDIIFIFFYSIVGRYIDMDLPNDPNQNQEVGNQNDEQRNITLDINEGLVTLRTFSHELRGTRDPSHLYLISWNDDIID